MQEIVTKKMGYTVPTPIQAYTIPAVLSGADVIGISQTGEYRSPNFSLATY
jgi:superfamily II DNA/RNA helicase